jgi:translation elongation factor EF-Tu-like GTPase
MPKNPPQVEAAMTLLCAAGDGLVKGGMDREDVARGMLLAALKTVHPIADLAQQADWLRQMARGLDLANMSTENPQ